MHSQRALGEWSDNPTRLHALGYHHLHSAVRMHALSWSL
eukprot:SAG31_NODE_32015_length_361_cov_0.751908_1_plen_38_part_10